MEVAYKRKGLEADIGKNIAEAEAAKEKNKIEDDKNKIEQNKQFDLLPATVNLPHTEAFANFYNQEADKLAEILTRNGGIVPIAGPDGAAYRRSTQAIKQTAANSEQLNKEMLRELALVDANSDKFLPGTREQIMAVYSDPSWLTKGVLPPSVMEDRFDVNGYLEPLFSKIKADQDATGYVTAEGGTDESTTKYILRDDIKSTAVMGAADPIAFAALKRQLQNMSPEMQGKIAKIAQDNGITPEAAAALELGIGLVEFTEKTRDVTAPNAAGYDMAVDEIGAINFIEKGIGMNDPANKGKTLKEIGLNDVGTVTDFLNNNPELQRFSIDIPASGEIFNGYNGMIYETKEAGGQRINRYVAGIVREPKTGNMQLVTVDGQGGTPKVSKPISSEKFYSEVMDPLAVNAEELDHKSVGYVYQKKYGPILGKQGNIELPKKGGGNPVDNTLGGKWGSKAAANKYN